jgi:hypothetical protein
MSVASVTIVRENLLEPSKYSSSSRLIRITAWSVRFCHNVKNRTDRHTGLLQVQELNDALKYWITVSQSQHFTDEIHALSRGNEISRSSRLTTLTPFIQDGILRVGGRLKNAVIPYDSKHQIIIPKEHVISRLLVSDTHVKLNHAGTEHTLAGLRKTYWIIHARSLVKTDDQCLPSLSPQSR